MFVFMIKVTDAIVFVMLTFN